MSSEFAELRSIWYTEEELQERIREFDNFLIKTIARKEGFVEVIRDSYEEGRREIAAELIQHGMSIDEISQITELPVETLESLKE